MYQNIFSQTSLHNPFSFSIFYRYIQMYIKLSYTSCYSNLPPTTLAHILSKICRLFKLFVHSLKKCLRSHMIIIRNFCYIKLFRWSGYSIFIDPNLHKQFSLSFYKIQSVPKLPETRSIQFKWVSSYKTCDSFIMSF